MIKPSVPFSQILLIAAILSLCFPAAAPADFEVYTGSTYNIPQNDYAAEAEKLVSQGDYRSALEAFEKARLLYQQGHSETGELFCLERMGWLQREVGEYAKALDLFRAAHAIGERLNGDAAEVDADIADVYMFSGDAYKAREHSERAITTLKDFVFPTTFARTPRAKEFADLFRKSTALIHARVNLGMLSYFLGDYPQALDHLRLAAATINNIKSVKKDPMYGPRFELDAYFYEGEGYCKTLLAAAYGGTREFDQAWPLFEEGKAAFEKTNRHFGLLVTQALFFRAENLAKDIRPDNKPKFEEYDLFLDTLEQFGATELLWRTSHDIARSLIKYKEYARAEHYLARAIVSLEQTRSRLRDDEIKMMFAASVGDVYADMVNVLFDMDKPAEGFNYLERAKARAFLDAVAGRPLKTQTEVDPTLAARHKNIQERIEAAQRGFNSVLGAQREPLYQEYTRLLAERRDILEAIKDQSLEYAANTSITTVPVHDLAASMDEQTSLVSYFVGKERLIIWAVSKGAVTATAVNVTEGDLANQVAAYRRSIAERETARVSVLGKQLYDLLIAPVKNNLSATDTLIIVPSKALHYLPFTSLPDPADRLLIEDFTISVLPNASSLLYLDQETAQDRDNILAVGNPHREEAGLALAFAEEEIRVITENFPERTVLTGENATESAFRELAAEDTGIIHIAAHGIYDLEDPLASALLLGKDGQHDGNLETFEIFGLTVNSGLVVLSACESGIGAVQEGDEIQSLNRAFLYAGAGSVVASLWSVSDESTAVFMGHFYKALETQPAATALRDAQIRLINAGLPAYHWAAFYLTGAPQRSNSLFVPNNSAHADGPDKTF